MLGISFGDFLIVLAIGVIAGLVMNRFGRSWLGRQVADVTGVGDVTYSLVGIAGAFIGYHLGSFVAPSAIVPFVVAIVGSLAVIWLWRGR